MDFITIFQTIFKYGLLALAIIIVLSAIYGIGSLIYKKAFHGTKTLSKKQWIVLILITGWYLLVLGLTTISRSANYGNINLSLFSGYINAWNKWSYRELQLIIFNMLMFAPLGFLLPLLSKKCEKLSLVSVISFLATLLIEVIQLITGKGIFELDDLFHNFIGSIFGYFVIMFVLDIISNKRVKLKSTLKMLLIPFAYIIIILVALLIYNNQKYGNLDFLPTKNQNMTIIEINNNIKLNDETKRVSIYKNKYINNFNRAKEFSKMVEDLENIKFNKTIRTEGNNKIFESNSSYQLTYFMDNGAWSYVTWKEISELSNEELESNKLKIENWLNKNNLLIENADFSVQNNNMIRWDVKNENILENKKDFESGLIMAQFTKDNEIASLDYAIIYNKYINEDNIISVNDAYNKLLKGNFNQYNSFKKGDQLYIDEYSLDYVYDSKGYYRPVYIFKGYINNKDNAWECKISALK